MKQLATIGASFGRLGRRWRAWRARLRRERATVALLAVVTLGLSEPLACILHCQLWLPFVFHSYLMAQHQHMHHDHQHMHMAQAAEPAPAGAASAAVQRSGSPDAPICAWHLEPAGGADGPFYVPPSPVHEMVPAMGLLLIMLVLISAAPIAPPGDPPRVALPPPFRPPIPIAL